MNNTVPILDASQKQKAGSSHWGSASPSRGSSSLGRTPGTRITEVVWTMKPTDDHVPPLLHVGDLHLRLDVCRSGSLPPPWRTSLPPTWRTSLPPTWRTSWCQAFPHGPLTTSLMLKKVKSLPSMLWEGTRLLNCWGAILGPPIAP